MGNQIPEAREGCKGLADRVEAGCGPDLEAAFKLRAEIWFRHDPNAAFNRTHYADDFEAWFQDTFIVRQKPRGWLPDYLASLDAATTLLGPGWRWFKCTAGDGTARTRIFVCDARTIDGRFTDSGQCICNETNEGNASALTAAVLRALATVSQSIPEGTGGMSGAPECCKWSAAVSDVSFDYVLFLGTEPPREPFQGTSVLLTGYDTKLLAYRNVMWHFEEIREDLSRVIRGVKARVRYNSRHERK